MRGGHACAGDAPRKGAAQSHPTRAHRQAGYRPALAVPGVQAVITHADFVEHGNFGWPVKGNYILAYGKVRYVGDAIAAVAAESSCAAQAGLDAIVLELEALPVVSDMTRALDADAPMIPDRPATLTAGAWATATSATGTSSATATPRSSSLQAR